MSRSLNKVQLIGNLGADPEVRSTNNGSRVATLSVATSRQWTGKSGDKQEKTEWHRVILWNTNFSKLADIAEKYCKKGDKVYVEGSIEYRTWQDREGQTKYTTEINGRELILLGGRSGGSDESLQRAEGRRGRLGAQEGRIVRRLPRGARRRGRRPPVLIPAGDDSGTQPAVGQCPTAGLVFQGRAQLLLFLPPSRFRRSGSGAGLVLLAFVPQRVTLWASGLADRPGPRCNSPQLFPETEAPLHHKDTHGYAQRVDGAVLREGSRGCRLPARRARHRLRPERPGSGDSHGPEG